MAIQLLELHGHPTVLTSATVSGSFEGWGVRIG